MTQSSKDKFIDGLGTLVILAGIAVMGSYSLKVALSFVAIAGVIHFVDCWVNRKTRKYVLIKKTDSASKQ